jgi:TRAP transporter 4TM/12TM fusion protein
MEEQKGSGTVREFGTRLTFAVSALAIAMTTFQMISVWFPLTGMQQRSIHFGFVITLIFLTVPFRAKGARGSIPVYDWLFALAGIFVAGYIFWEHELLASERMGWPNGMDLLVGTLIIILVFEGTRRMSGWTLPIIAGIFLAYDFFGEYIPGAAGHGGQDFSRIVGTISLFSEGIFGMPLGVISTFVVMFIVFGAFLLESGTGQFFIDLAFAFFGRIRGGPAKVAVVASGLFGTISGSVIANIVGTGTFTIPLMKRSGYRAIYAASVEAVASSGGQLMPPVMGASAFLIAEILGIPYIRVCLAALVPAVIYYAAVFIAVDLEAARWGLKGLPAKELPNIRQLLKEKGHLSLPVLVLIYFLAFAWVSPQRAAFWAIVSTVGVSYLRKSTRMSPKSILIAMEKGARGILEIAVVCAIAGVVIGSFTLTGLGLKLSTILIDIAGGNLALLLALSMGASLILGMGLPTVACYLILAVLVAPAMIKMGVLPLAAHLFVFYFGIIAAITPPVALGAYVAAGIAGSPPFRTGWVSCRLALVAFILPYMFVFEPNLILRGEISTAGAIQACITGMIGSAALASALQGYILRPLRMVFRLMLGAAAFCLIKPGTMTDIFGGMLVAVVLMVEFAAWRRVARPPQRQPVPTQP